MMVPRFRREACFSTLLLRVTSLFGFGGGVAGLSRIPF
ncbi:hypothetical protein VDG1235_4833 [Verrucomicrobiia bacterium DG1235]|nr:hypothetical protein VDG1235_4833 [Verrucomicrobiae bacterium DG1235]